MRERVSSICAVVPQTIEPKSVRLPSAVQSAKAIIKSHDSPPPWIARESITTVEGHGGEQTENTSVTTFSCTEVCGDSLHRKSCSKMCLVNVYPKGHHEQKKKMCVMLDDQSNLSLARSALFDMFNIQGNVSPYTLKTCSGIVWLTRFGLLV